MIMASATTKTVCSITCHLTGSIDGCSIAIAIKGAEEGSEVGHHTTAIQECVVINVAGNLCVTYHLSGRVDAYTVAEGATQGSEVGHHAAAIKEGMMITRIVIIAGSG